MKIKVNVIHTQPPTHKNSFLHILGNIINLPFAIVEAMTWTIYGIVWCCTIIGIPFGIQCFKLAKLALWPFGKNVILKNQR